MHSVLCVPSVAMAILGEGGVCLGGVCWGVSAKGCLPGGVYLGSVLLGGVCHVGVCCGVSAQGGLPRGCLPRGVYHSMQWGRPPWTEFLTLTCENIAFPQLLLRTVTIYLKAACEEYEHIGLGLFYM